MEEEEIKAREKIQGKSKPKVSEKVDFMEDLEKRLEVTEDEEDKRNLKVMIAL